MVFENGKGKWKIPSLYAAATAKSAPIVFRQTSMRLTSTSLPLESSAA
jgi:hypothetical protein